MRACCILWPCLVLLHLTLLDAKKTPDASSTLLRLHKSYWQPPHDTVLYDLLHVAPNATAAQITKSFRRLCRKWHPDKYHGDDFNEQLQKVRRAYDILHNDALRLSYHQYGIADPTQAVALLTGRLVAESHSHRQIQQLLQLMGADRNSSLSHAHRVRLVAARLVEQLRPVVEGWIDKETLAQNVAMECDQLKGLPLGAHILRCVGRAYRHAGLKVLRQSQYGGTVSEQIRQGWRQAKHAWNAVLASGRVVVKEQLWKTNEIKSDNAIEYRDIGELDPDMAWNDEEIKQQEWTKAENAVLQSLQVEALWKISKIELDRTIREACEMILSGSHFFFPSHQSVDPGEHHAADGWVGSRDVAVRSEEGRIRAAETLVLIGDVMVQRSKEGTAWKE